MHPNYTTGVGADQSPALEPPLWDLRLRGNCPPGQSQIPQMADAPMPNLRYTEGRINAYERREEFSGTMQAIGRALIAGECTTGLGPTMTGIDSQFEAAKQ